MKAQLMAATVIFATAISIAQDVEQSNSIQSATEESEVVAIASVENANADADIAIDADDTVQEAFDAFMESKADAGFSSFGKAHPKSGIVYYAEMETVNGIGAKDAEFIQKRQTAFMRAYMKIREDYVKFSVNGAIQSLVENEFMKDKDAERAQDIASSSQIERLAQKTLALAESELNKKLESAGLSPARFATAAEKRKAYMQKILAQASSHAFSSCAGISVVQTIEAEGDGGYTIGVIAKFDPQFVYYADCFARQICPQPSKPGIDVGVMLKGDLSQNFGTRFFYDESGMPALISFGQWAVTNPSKDRTERKMQEKAARLQAESQANIDMNNFMSGSMTFDEAAKGGEEWSKTIAYDEDGMPVMSTIDSAIADFVNRKSVTKAKLGMAGRDMLVSKFVTHPDTKQKIAIAAACWSFSTLANQQKANRVIQTKGRNVLKENSSEEDNEGRPAKRGSIRQGQVYDF